MDSTKAVGQLGFISIAENLSSILPSLAISNSRRFKIKTSPAACFGGRGALRPLLLLDNYPPSQLYHPFSYLPFLSSQTCIPEIDEPFGQWFFPIWTIIVIITL
jgi:hypothetical protein